jgi:HAD superfamily, subfamily IIIB (Acid phosphatase)
VLRTAIAMLVVSVLALAAARAQQAALRAGPVDPRLGCDTATAFPAPDLGVPTNIDIFKKQLLYYRCTACDHDVAKVLADAQCWVAARAPQVARHAIVLDIDETSLSNWPRIYQDDFAFISGGACDFEAGDPCGDLDWEQSALAQAIAPTLLLYNAARCVGQPDGCNKVEVFFLTGRKESKHQEEMASVYTLRNLDHAGYGTIARDHLYMRDPAGNGSVSNHKTAARVDIEAKGFVIIANIGDQKSDLAGGHAEMTFKVPNPFYFIP